jgi:hypothetical protein
MANPTAPATPLHICGTDYTLTWDFQAIADAEEILGRSLITGLSQRDLKAPPIKLVQGMLYACIRKNHPAVTFAEARAMVTLKNIGKIWTAVTDTWVTAMNEPDEDAPVGESKVQN